MAVPKISIIVSCLHPCFMICGHSNDVLGACRAKIAACVARGGVADKDCPSDEASMKFWCHLTEKETTRDKVKVNTKATVNVAAGTVVDALGTGFPSQNLVHVANPAQMIASRVAATATAASSPQADMVSPVASGPLLLVNSVVINWSCL